jgi:hypothetical protein
MDALLCCVCVINVRYFIFSSVIHLAKIKINPY